MSPETVFDRLYFIDRQIGSELEVQARAAHSRGDLAEVDRLRVLGEGGMILSALTPEERQAIAGAPLEWAKFEEAARLAYEPTPEGLRAGRQSRAAFAAGATVEQAMVHLHEHHARTEARRRRIAVDLRRLGARRLRHGHARQATRPSLPRIVSRCLRSRAPRSRRTARSAASARGSDGPLGGDTDPPPRAPFPALDPTLPSLIFSTAAGAP